MQREPITAVVAQPDQWKTLGEVMARSFDDDPIWMWICQDATKRRAHVGSLFGELIRPQVLASNGYTTADEGGVAVWAPPGEWKGTFGRTLRCAVPAVRSMGLGHVWSRLGMQSHLERIHPTEPHWYLEFLATDPPMQGKGVGTAVLQPVLDECDRTGVPAFLESSKESNLAYYARFGFVVTNQVDLPGGCPPMWQMWRDPK